MSRERVVSKLPEELRVSNDPTRTARIVGLVGDSLWQSPQRLLPSAPVRTSRTPNAPRMIGSGRALPGDPIPSSVIESLFGRPPGWIERKLGIRTRHWARDLKTGRPRPGCRNSELAAAAARSALTTADVAPAEIDLLIVATASPDYALPAVAPLVQELLGISECVALDIRSACTGFLQALQVATNAIECGTARTACVIGSETPSLLLNLEAEADYTDKIDFVNAALFGDGAGAMIVRASRGAHDATPRIGAVHLGSVGLGRPPGITIEGSGSADPATAESLRAGHHRVRQDYQQVLATGPELYQVAMRAVLNSEDARPDDIALGIPHQANGTIAQMAKQVLGEVGERFFVNVDAVGNCGAASVPIAFDEAVRLTPPRPGDLVVFVAAEASKWLYGGASIRW